MLESGWFQCPLNPKMKGLSPTVGLLKGIDVGPFWDVKGKASAWELD